MALIRVLLIAMMVARALAADHIVGDNKGWNTIVDYAVWADKQDFHVGDSITFMYTRNDHNVIKVNASEFLQCTYSYAADEIWTTGFDVIALATPGKHCFISGINQDCYEGMKLVVTVSEDEGPAPAPMPGSFAPPPTTSAAAQLSPFKSCAWLLALMAACLFSTKY